MLRRRGKEDFDFEYEDGDEEERRGGSGKSLFLLLLAALLIALTVLCVVLTLRLRGANAEVENLQQQLKAAESVKWEAPQALPSVPTETVPIPGTEAEATPAPTAEPEPTPTPTPEPTPTPTPAPVVAAGELPSWITEENMAKITRRPKDDEWYGSPGKLYVIATLGLNLRTGTRTDIDNIITQIKCGSEVEVYAASGNMRFVQDPKGNFGWCSTKLLSNEPPAGVTVTPFRAAAAETPTPVVAPTAPPATAGDDAVPVPEAPTING